MAHTQKRLSVLLALSFLVSSSTGTMARRAYSSYDYEHTKDADVEYEPDSVQTKSSGYTSDWNFLKTAEADATLKDTLLKQAESGDAAAMYKLACMYFHGKGTERDLVEALKWNRQAAFKGNSLAQNNLGYMFDEGKGTKKDPFEAMKWYRTAANFGCAAAQCNVGYMFEHGKGTANDAKDLKEAADWYQKAADQGNLVAKRNLYLFAQQGIKVASAAAPEIDPATGTSSAAQSAGSVTPVATPAVKAAGTPIATTPTVKAAVPAVAAPAKPVVATADSAPKATAPSVEKKAAPVEEKVASKPTAAPAVATATTAESTAPAAAAAQTTTSESGDSLTAGSDKLTALLRKMTAARAQSAAEGKGAVDGTAEASKPETASKAAVAEVTTKSTPELVTAKPTEAPKVETFKKVVVESKKAEIDAKRAEVVTVKSPDVVAVKPEVVAKKVDVEIKKPEAEVKAIANVTDSSKTPASDILAKSASAKIEKAESLESAKPISVATVTVDTKTEKPMISAAVQTTVSALTDAIKATSSSTAAASAQNRASVPPATTAVPAAKPSTASPTAVASAAASGKDKTAQRPVRDKWALVVGISDFESPGIPKLKYSSKDATDFYNYLVKDSNFAPDHVRLLLNDKATFRRVMSELGTKFLARVAKPDDLVLLYFSTHGSPSQMDIRGKNYLVAYDSDPNDLFATGIEMQKILESIQNRVLTDRVVLVMDACHSGFTEANAKGMGRVGNFDADELAQGSGQLVLCSSEPAEQAWESTRYQNGVFTRKLLKGLQSKGPNTTLIDAYNTTRREVQDEVREDRAGVRQTPVLKGKWNGNDLIVAIPPSAPQVVPQAVKRELEPDSATVLGLASATTKAETRKLALKDSPKELIKVAIVSPAQEPEAAKPAESTAAAADMSLVAKAFYPDSEPKSLLRECYASLKSGNSRNPAETYYLRAQAYIQLKEWNNAINDLTDAIHSTPNKASYYLARAYARHRNGQSLQAKEDLDEAKFCDRSLPAKITFGD